MCRLLLLRLALVAWLAGVTVCLSVSGSQLRFEVSQREQSYLDALHHPELTHQREGLDHAFNSIDDDSDGHLSFVELDSLLAEDRLTDAEHMLMRAFDTDGSGDLSREEFLLAPLTLNMLETDASLSPSFHMRPMRHAASSMQSSEEAAAAAAFEGRPSGQHRRLRTRRTRDMAFNEMSSRAYAIPADASSANRNKTTDHTNADPGSKRGNTPLPVSIFGVPSVADEECVMCLYFVQRIQSAIASKLESAPSGAPPAIPVPGGQGLPGAAAAAQEALKVRNSNAQLVKKPGGRGIVRVVSEDVMSHLCRVDKMPLIFSPYCKAFEETNTINAIRKGIFFNIPTTEVCSQAQLCRDDSYLNSNAAVHATKTSLFLNSQRGICGMLGGARDRPQAREGLIISAVCAAHGAVFVP